VPCTARAVRTSHELTSSDEHHKGHCAGDRRVPYSVTVCAADEWTDNYNSWQLAADGEGGRGVQTRNWRRNVVTGHPVCRIYGRFHLPVQSKVTIEKDWKVRHPSCLIPMSILRVRDAEMMSWKEVFAPPHTQNRASENFTKMKQDVLKTA
jgi:hypothetical protein